ncbi:MAG: thiamine pyrophosphate-dependent enzyme [Sandaracinaceae bacterium]
MQDRATEPVDVHLLEALADLGGDRRAGALDRPVRTGAGLTGRRALELFECQIGSRHLDLAARWLRSRGKGFYTIGSSGHEGNAAVAAALRPTDPALLHYRSGGFYLARAQQAGHDRALEDVMLGVCAARTEPIAGGRHKVFGHRGLAVIPQTSTIASHLPRAVGVAFAIERAKKLRVSSPWPADALVVTSFGDASANHSTATGAINTACHCAHQHLPLPVLFVCEDNGIGISVRTPSDWIHAAYGARPHLRYFYADGCDLAQTFEVATCAARFVRERRKPAFLHLRTVRFMGHAGSDAEVTYRSAAEIRADYARDPILATARLLVEAGVATGPELAARYEAKRDEVRAIALRSAEAPQLVTAEEVMAPLAPRRDDAIAVEAARGPSPEARARMHDGKLPEDEGPLTLSLAINRALADAIALDPRVLLFGEDVGRKGGVYGLTKGLLKRAGAGRVFDTLLDEQSILGLALGAAVSGFVPIPEIQYLAYLHNAEDQLRGEAATLRFFSNGQYVNPMVVRIAGYGYQKGFGGHFHNDDSVAVLRDIPGLVIASPARPDDAAAMMRTCLAAARTDGLVSVFLEPIALYHTRDLHEDGDGAWLAPYPAPDRWAETHVPLGRARLYPASASPALTLVTSGNGLFMSLRAQRRLAAEGLHADVVDLRWLAPLPIDDVLAHAERTGRVLVVDETRRTGGIAETVLAALLDRGFEGPLGRVASHDSFIPLGDAARAVLLDEPTLEAAARRLAARPRCSPRK